MKKKYSRMEIAVIPVDNDVATTSGENCVIITQLENSGDPNARCDLTPDEYVQREWYGDNKGLEVTLNSECYG